MSLSTKSSPAYGIIKAVILDNCIFDTFKKCKFNPYELLPSQVTGLVDKCLLLVIDAAKNQCEDCSEGYESLCDMLKSFNFSIPDQAKVMQVALDKGARMGFMTANEIMKSSAYHTKKLVDQARTA